MSNDTSDKYDNVTLIDLKLASVYYPILIDLAKHKRRLTYGQLITKAQELNPDIPEVQNAVPVGTGRRLEVIRYFTSKNGYPDLTSLIVNKSSGECGEWVLKRFDPDKLREEVLKFDWSQATNDFDGFIKQTGQNVLANSQRKPRAPKTNDAQIKARAEVVMYEYYKQNKSSLPPTITKKRDLIVKLLMQGIGVEEAFLQATTQ